ncbi:MAG: cytochrome c family protein, partial [Candidatus Eisenbacteria bacterium]|nr:cytochrome c family protein [Candidatus Eisenbacteria bacterium]
VDVNRESTPECVTCHVVGYQQSGGFHASEDAGKLGNVQCENCHGMGTQHEALAAAPAKVTEATCRSCHNSTTSPNFDFAVFQPHIVHQVPAVLPKLPPSPAQDKMKAGH